jgi:hypothetical protein
MFEKYFKKKEVIKPLEVMVIDEPVTGKHVYPKEIYEIHHEFEVASDKLVQSANDVLKEAASKDVNKVGRLLNLGFKQVQQVVEIEPLIKKAELSKEQIDLVAYYKQNYPFNKFITEEQVEIICKKYNLVCGDVERFKGFVPEKNLKQIEKFKLKENEQGLYTSTGLFLKNAEIRTNGIANRFQHIYVKGDNSGNYAFQREVRESRFYANDTYNIFGLSSLGNISFNIRSNNLHICAPIKDMDMSDMTITRGYKMQEVVKHIPDPVVLHPVKGGYLILTAWGDEASDPMVTNEINN